MRRANEKGARPRALVVGGLAAAAVLVPGAAQAHFRLMTPTQWIVEGDTTAIRRRRRPAASIRR